MEFLLECSAWYVPGRLQGLSNFQHRLVGQLEHGSCACYGLMLGWLAMGGFLENPAAMGQDLNHKGGSLKKLDRPVIEMRVPTRQGNHQF